METKNNIAILIPTKNRAEFVIRQLHYYTSVRSQYPVYIGDSSNSEHSLKIQKAIEQMKGALTVHYFCKPEFNYCKTTIHLLSLVKEEYICMIGDDDFQIPSSLEKCAEFLDTHKDYASAHGNAVAIRIMNNAVYGKIGKIKDYPQPQCEQNSANDRVLNFFNQYYVSHFSVVRAEVMKKAWSRWAETPERSFSEEILDATLIVVMGKSKLLDCLSFIRQIHDQHYLLPNTFDWITSSGWDANYLAFQKIVTEEITKKDNISQDTAQASVREAFWSYLQKWLALDYQTHMSKHYPRIAHPTMKEKIKKYLYFLMPMYKIIKPYVKKKRWIHAEVVNPSSPYYKDFKAVKYIIENI